MSEKNKRRYSFHNISHNKNHEAKIFFSFNQQNPNLPKLPLTPQKITTSFPKSQSYFPKSLFIPNIFLYKMNKRRYNIHIFSLFNHRLEFLLPIHLNHQQSSNKFTTTHFLKTLSKNSKIIIHSSSIIFLYKRNKG